MNDPKRILVVLLASIILMLGCFSIKGHMDSEGYKNQVNYTTAVQATDKDHFNYAVDSQQGRILARGKFTTTTKKLAKFPEMTKGFTYVTRTREHYTMHTRTVCTGSGKTESCHTEIYYTWDAVESEEKYSDKINLFGREYPTQTFFMGKFLHSTDACAITVKDTNTGFFHQKHGCSSGWGGDYYYIDDNDRYTYSTVPLSFTASFLASSSGGGLKGFSELRISLQDKSLAQILEDVGKYQLIGFWVLCVLLVILFIGAGVGAYYWVMADGEWSLDR